MVLFGYFKQTLEDKKIMKDCLKLAIPLMLQQFVLSSVNLVDNLMVGELGDVAVSGVSCANKYYNIFNFALNAIVMSCIIYLSQFNGAEDKEHMKQSYRFCVVSSYTIIFIFFIIGLLFPSFIIKFIINDQAIIDCGVDYLKIACFSYLPLGMTFAIGSSLRAIGKPKLPLILSIISVITNIVFDYLLIFGKFGFPMLGVKGAAYATVLARVVEMTLYIYFLEKDDYPFKSKIQDIFKFDGELAKQIIIKAIPLMANEILWQFGNTTLLKFYSSRGAQVNTAYSISITIADLFFILFSGMATATTVLVGSPLGAGKIKEAKDNAYKLLCFSMMLSIVFASMMALSSLLVPVLYGKVSIEAQDLAASFIRVMAIFFIIYMFNTQCYLTLRTGGDTKHTMIMDSMFMWVINIPIVMFLAYKTSIPVLFVYILGQSTDIVKSFIAYHMFKKEKWAVNLTNLA